MNLRIESFENNRWSVEDDHLQSLKDSNRIARKKTKLDGKPRIVIDYNPIDYNPISSKRLPVIRNKVSKSIDPI